ncbi:amino acid permease-domain-containing protein [Hypoxylon rubiginosum]|uniref:Amino acid permease-domain-containing protein n=1 Tax=Hypoxylon rubiginosum TaxID=110542 RepID=A0ACC0D9R4_9PEZI|nr:amino acid permease-domain-containing protein [Hypoxylon rubiginosum]
MQCITELLCIWPVPGALSVFVRVFVDTELGIVVGVAYWFTYSVGFAALIAASAAEVHYWTDNYWADSRALDAGVLYLLIPLMLIVINCFGIEIYGWFEVATGILKLLFLVIIIIAMIVFAAIPPQDPNEKNSWDDPGGHDEIAARNWATALFMCLSTATFAYVGVETPAAAALEARPTKPRRASSVQHERGNEASSIGMTLRFSAQWISFLACAAYILSGILVSLSVNRHDCHLPRTGWLVYPQCRNQTTIESGFTLVPESRGNLALRVVLVSPGT